LFLILLFFIPESPRWLALIGREEESFIILKRINGSQGANRIVGEIKNSATIEQGSLFSFGWKLILVGVALSAFQQLVGINVVLYYGPEIFKNIGSGTNSALLQTIVIGAVNLIFCIGAINTVDRFGRKPLQIAGAVIMGAAMIILGFVFLSTHLGYLALLCMILFMAGFSFSWGPVVWVLLSEIFPNKIRGRAMSIAVAVQWIMNYLVSWTFPMLDKSSFLTRIFHHGFAYWVYGMMAVFAALFMWKLVPETKGKSLEQMEELWHKSRTPILL
jgi:SP family xylose:H+ symportor-like MFS transporter